MAKWTFEPGHTAAGFTARHMMVTNVRGHFKDVHGSLVFDPEDPTKSSTEVTIDARKIWTGEPARDEHLRSADFLDVEKFPEITFRDNHHQPPGLWRQLERHHGQRRHRRQQHSGDHD